jgi:hypothetical protein
MSFFVCWPGTAFSWLNERVIQEKTLGLKTEPAFAKLLALETADVQQLRALVQQHGY